MTTRTMGEWLRAAILGLGVCLIPAAALADDGATPDHAQAQAGTGADNRAPTAERTEGAPDHTQAEARGGSGDVVPGAERAGTTDHATVESRGAAAPR
ncbi:MAG TPA: hypothetical protein VHL80_09620 [Polyangia bacterium]|nr:hypothetical protein [Polyangia bacterium]